MNEANINFKVIQEFLFKYGKTKLRTKNDDYEQKKKSATAAIQEIVKFNKKIADKINNGNNKIKIKNKNNKEKIEENDYQIYIRENSYQNSGTCADYFWSRIVKKKYEKSVFSISIFFNDDDSLTTTLEQKKEETESIEKPTEKQLQNFKNIDSNEKSENNDEYRKYEKCISNSYSEISNKDTNAIIENIAREIINLIEPYNKIFDEDEKKGESAMTYFPLNQILYGPPGTGKTYNTVIKAMEIIDGKKYTDNNGNLLKTVKYEDLKQSFDEAKKKHRIEFITFHQSYSYEEFVEGIKPYIPQNVWKNINEQNLSDLKYVGKKGIFREICDRAKEIQLLTFEDIYEEFKTQYPNSSIISWDKYQYKISYNSEGSLTDDTKAHTSMPMDKLKIFFDADKKANFISPSALQKYAEANNISTNGMQNSTFVAIKLMRNIRVPYVLIIDEINRGNISKIFGELITLIEEDKRKKVYEDGKEYNTLEVTLPYSQEPFYVPNNLYIIGTMNTADRSIASVDIALRRRFRFVEMMPKPNLLKINDNELVDVIRDNEKQYKINLEKLLTVLNDRISYILDDDHQIGHSYFLKLLQSKDGQIYEKELTDVFKYEILPLLNEYFYDDWEKIKAVLVKDSENNENLIEGSFIEEKEAQTLSCYCGDKKQCRFKKEFNIKEAIESIADDIIQ